MIIGRVHENNRDLSNTQVVITQSEESDHEELCLQDIVIVGEFLSIPASECTSSKHHQFPAVNLSSLLNYKILLSCRKIMTSAEGHCLEHVLSTMEKELVKTQTQLLEAKKEVACICV